MHCTTLKSRTTTLTSAVEVEHISDVRARRTPNRPHPPPILRPCKDLVGRIQTNHLDRNTAGKDNVGRLGVAVDVELSSRGDIAPGQGATHQADLLDPLR